ARITALTVRLPNLHHAVVDRHAVAVIDAAFDRNLLAVRVGRDEVVADRLFPGIGGVRIRLRPARRREAVGEERADGLRWRDFGHGWPLMFVVVQRRGLAAAQDDVEAEAERR